MPFTLSNTKAKEGDAGQKKGTEKYVPNRTPPRIQNASTWTYLSVPFFCCRCTRESY